MYYKIDNFSSWHREDISNREIAPISLCNFYILVRMIIAKFIPNNMVKYSRMCCCDGTDHLHINEIHVDEFEKIYSEILSTDIYVDKRIYSNELKIDAYNASSLIGVAIGDKLAIRISCIKDGIYCIDGGYICESIDDIILLISDLLNKQ